METTENLIDIINKFQGIVQNNIRLWMIIGNKWKIKKSEQIFSIHMNCLNLPPFEMFDFHSKVIKTIRYFFLNCFIVAVLTHTVSFEVVSGQVDFDSHFMCSSIQSARLP